MAGKSNKNRLWHFNHAGKIFQTHFCSHTKHYELDQRGDESCKFKSVYLNKITRENQGGCNSSKDHHGIRKSLKKSKATEPNCHCNKKDYQQWTCCCNISIENQNKCDNQTYST